MKIEKQLGTMHACDWELSYLKKQGLRGTFLCIEFSSMIKTATTYHDWQEWQFSSFPIEPIEGTTNAGIQAICSSLIPTTAPKRYQFTAVVMLM